MPVVDMPLEQLEQYKGKNPCPENFDSYWQNAMGEMDAVKPDVEMTKSDFQTSFATCYDMYFTGVKQARIYAKVAIPKNVKNAPALLMFHGYAGSSGKWLELMPYAAAGFVVAFLDCRGQGGKSQDSSSVPGNTFHGHIIRGLEGKAEDLLFRQIYLDTAQLAKIVADFDEVDSSRMACLGMSQGGALSVACASLSPLIKKIAVQYPFLSDYRRVWEMDFRTSAYEELWLYFRTFDPLHKREDEIFEKLGYIDVHHLAKKMTAEVLMAISLRDNICPPSTQFAIYNNISSNKELLLYRDFSHETLPGFEDTAFQWLTSL